MSTLKLDGREELTIDVKRRDDEWRTLRVKIETEDGEVIIEAGRFHDDAWSLKTMFETLAKQIEDEILRDWQDVPDYDSDGWISCDRGEYYVSVEGSDWDGDMFPARNQNSQRKQTAFPSLEIATIELAKAMVESGCFPACWFQHDNGYMESIEDAVRAWHDDGGTAMIPLPGVRFQPGDEALVRYTNHDRSVSWDPVEIIKDYGDAGIIYCWPGDGDPHLVDVPSEVRTQEEHVFEDYRGNLQAFLEYKAKIQSNVNNETKDT